jgi:hypothetical protein
MRKQLTILNTMMKNGTHWDENLLKVLTGKHSHLPIPTTVLIGADGIVKWVDQSENYRQRSGPDTVLSALKANLPAFS